MSSNLFDVVEGSPFWPFNPFPTLTSLLPILLLLAGAAQTFAFIQHLRSRAQPKRVKPFELVGMNIAAPPNNRDNHDHPLPASVIAYTAGWIQPRKLCLRPVTCITRSRPIPLSHPQTRRTAQHHRRSLVQPSPDTVAVLHRFFRKPVDRCRVLPVFHSQPDSEHNDSAGGARVFQVFGSMGCGLSDSVGFRRGSYRRGENGKNRPKLIFFSISVLKPF